MAVSKKAKRRSKAARSLAIQLDQRLILARRLDRLADAELQHGHHLAAERLAHRAVELRSAAR